MRPSKEAIWTPNFTIISAGPGKPGCWECFNTSAEAEASARELVRRDETYTIEEHDQGCARCRAAMKLKTVHTQANSAIQYPWQQLVSDAFLESRPEIVPQKVNVAERAISARLCDSTPTDLEEQIALRDALQALRSLLPKQAESDEERCGKTAVA